MDMSKPPTLLHISPVDRRKLILKEGLRVNMKTSGYGKKPKKSAVYLFHEDNINVVYDFIALGKAFDIWEVKLENSNFLVADEDSGADDWIESLETYGTVANVSDIGIDLINLLATVEPVGK